MDSVLFTTFQTVFLNHIYVTAVVIMLPTDAAYVGEYVLGFVSMSDVYKY